MTRATSYWFPAKRYGWGWGLPVAWQGWLVLVLWLLGLLGSAVAFLPRRIESFAVADVLLTALLVLACYWTGEPPTWRWGDRR